MTPDAQPSPLPAPVAPRRRRVRRTGGWRARLAKFLRWAADRLDPLT
jgi:hypothetical protein